MKLEDTPKLKRSFDTICTPGEDWLELRHLLCLLKNATLADNPEKLQFCFELYDEDDSRIITI